MHLYHRALIAFFFFFFKALQDIQEVSLSGQLPSTTPPAVHPHPNPSVWSMVAFYGGLFLMHSSREERPEVWGGAELQQRHIPVGNLHEKRREMCD